MAEDSKERLEAAHHHTIGRLSKAVEDKFRLKFSPPVLAAVAKLSLHYIEESAVDIEAFSRHAKRASVNSDDVKLLARKNPGLEQHLKKLQKP